MLNLTRTIEELRALRSTINNLAPTNAGLAMLDTAIAELTAIDGASHIYWNAADREFGSASLVELAELHEMQRGDVMQVQVGLSLLPPVYIAHVVTAVRSWDDGDPDDYDSEIRGFATEAEASAAYEISVAARRKEAGAS